MPDVYDGTKALYDEVLGLIIAARDYAQGLPQNPEFTALSCLEKVQVDVASLYATSRLVSCFAWVCSQRALARGEIIDDEDLEGLQGQRLCLDETMDTLPFLPRGVQNLMTQSLALYRRVNTLDRHRTARASGMSGPLPARTQMSLRLVT